MQTVPVELLSGLSPAATAVIGTAVGNLVSVQAGGKLPALDASNLTGVPTIPGASRGKVITVTGNTTADVSCSYLWATDGGTNFKLISGLSVTGASVASAGAINQLATGLTAAAATWYYVWGVCKSDGSGAGVVIGTSSSSPPTLPTGYTGGFYAYMGALRTAAGSAQLMGTMQKGRHTQYVVGLAQTTVSVIIAAGPVGTWSTTSPVLAAASVANFVPPTAAVIHVIPVTSYKGTNSQVMVAPSMAYSGANNGQGGSNGIAWIYNQNPAGDVSDEKIISVMLESTNLYWASGNAGGVIACMGWAEAD